MVSKARSELSEDREAELAKSRALLKSQELVRSGRQDTRSDYASIRAKAFAQEKQYSSGSLGHLDESHKTRSALSSGRKLEGTASEPLKKDLPSRHMEHDSGDTNTVAQRKAWDDEEKDLMQWTKERANGGRQRKQLESRQEGLPVESSRVPPLPGWGKSYSDEKKEQRLKQQQYAEALQRQMKEKYPHRSRLEAGTQRSRGADSRQRVSSRRGQVDSQSTDTSIANNHDTERDMPRSKDFSFSQKSGKSGSNDTRPQDQSSYPAQFPMYPYPPMPPGYQMPPGAPWPPPPFTYPYANYRYDQQQEIRPPVYYQSYYLSPPKNLPQSHGYGPVPSVPYPYNRPPPLVESREPLYSRHGNDFVPDHRKGHMAEYDSPPNSFRGRSEKSRVLDGSDTSPAQDKMEYRRQLQEQVREKKRRELEAKLVREREEGRKVADIYDPFGKGGCGAPVKDQHGNLVADLKQMRKINENRLSNNSVKVRPSSVLRSESKGSARLNVLSDSQDHSSAQETILTYSNRDTEGTRKNAQDSYRDYLKQQVLEKEKLKKEEKDKQRLEEVRQLEQLERDRKKMQEEFQLEQEKQRKKEEDLRKKNEAIKLEAEKERQRVLMQRQKEAEQEEEERRRIAAQELDMKIMSPRAPPVQYPRTTYSPPIPTLRHQLGEQVPMMQSETSLESSRHPPHTENPVRRSNRPYVAYSSTDDVTARMTPVFRHQPRNTTSPPVPAVRKKLTRSDNLVLDDNPEEVSAAAVANPTLEDRRGARLRPEQPGQAEGSSAPQRLLARNLPEGNNREILTQLGAIRMYLQEELEKQQSETETNSEIFERVKQHRPGLAFPKRPKGTNITPRTMATNRQVFDEDSTLALSVPRSDPSDQISLNNSDLTKITYRGLPKDAYSGSTLSSALLSKKSTAGSQRPWRNGVLVHPSSRVGEPSTRGESRNVEPVRRHIAGRQASPSGTSISTAVIDTMAERTAARMRRLDAIMNTTGYGEPSFDGQSIDNGGYRPGEGREGQSRGLHYTGSQNLRSHDLRRRSELNSDTRHLPIS